MTPLDLQLLTTARKALLDGSARRRREAAMIERPEVAAACGVHEDTIWRWEAGDRRPRGAAAIRFAYILASWPPA